MERYDGMDTRSLFLYPSFPYFASTPFIGIFNTLPASVSIDRYGTSIYVYIGIYYKYLSRLSSTDIIKWNGILSTPTPFQVERERGYYKTTHVFKIAKCLETLNLNGWLGIVILTCRVLSKSL